MKQSPELQGIQNRMQPGILSAEGFLGDDTRNLADILLEDRIAVERLGTDHTALAERMRYFSEKGKAGLGKPVIVDDIYEVTVEDYMGFLPCPFSDHCNVEKRNTRLTILKTGQVVCWTDLNIHMIEAHGFYEGKGSAFRVEPEEIVKALKVV